MKSYTVKQYTQTEFDAYTEEHDYIEENVITVVWSRKAVCMDIQATGTRLVPILRKIEAAMINAGLATRGAIYEGWFGAWADSLTDPTERPYFIWSYDGKNDRENGHWSYSWAIEQQDENQWYIFLNLARPEETTLPA